MKIIVLMKQVPDTAARISINPNGTGIVEEGIQYVVNPYDEYAVEEALKIKERFGEGEVVVVTMGPPRAKEALRQCFAMGADRGVHIIGDVFKGSDTYATALALSRAISRIGFDLILCGQRAVDGDCGHVGAQVAEMLNVPHVSIVIKEEISEDKKSVTVLRQVEGGEERVEVHLPALLTCQKGLNEPRYPTLKGIMGAKKKEIAEWGLDELGLKPEEVGDAGARAKMIKIQLPPPRQPGRVLKGEVDEAAAGAVRLLREEAKII